MNLRNWMLVAFHVLAILTAAAQVINNIKRSREILLQRIYARYLQIKTSNETISS